MSSSTSTPTSDAQVSRGADPEIIESLGVAMLCGLSPYDALHARGFNDEQIVEACQVIAQYRAKALGGVEQFTDDLQRAPTPELIGRANRLVPLAGEILGAAWWIVDEDEQHALALAWGRFLCEIGWAMAALDEDRAAALVDARSRIVTHVAEFCDDLDALRGRDVVRASRPAVVRTARRARRSARVGSSSSRGDPPDSEADRPQHLASPQAGAGSDLESGDVGGDVG